MFGTDNQLAVRILVFVRKYQSFLPRKLIVLWWWLWNYGLLAVVVLPSRDVRNSCVKEVPFLWEK